MHPRNVKIAVNRRAPMSMSMSRSADHGASTEPLVSLFSALANWRAAEQMSGRAPRISWTLHDDPPARWLLSIAIDDQTVFLRSSSHVWQLAIDAERAFRSWTDERDRKENEALLGASAKDGR